MYRLNLRLFCLGWCVIACMSVFAQSERIEMIKHNPSYYWGEGRAATASRADQAALSMLCEQISVSVESSFEMTAKEQTQAGSGNRGKDSKMQYQEFATSMVKTHARATLKNTERIVIQGDDYYVFRYINRGDVGKIFDERKLKAEEFYKLAVKAEQQQHVAEAMKYYYWSLGLVKSHPQGMQLQFVDGNKRLQNAVGLLTRSIQSILNNIHFSLKERNSGGCWCMSLINKNR